MSTAYATAEPETVTVESVPLPVCGDICPLTGTETCETNPDKVRNCPAC